MIWLIGNKGMLGQDVGKLFKRKRLSYLTSDKEVDIANYQILQEFTKDIKIEWIINCSGYTDVDKAEKEIAEAFQINRDGVRNISKIAAEKQSKLIHISTDYVFDGRQRAPFAYSEEDETNPINVYGKSKLAGEQEIEKILEEYFIIRTAWLYGVQGNNFVYSMLRLFKERDVVKVINDQIGSPTYTADLAGVILKIIESNFSGYGIYHFTNEGVTSWYEFARAIYDKSKDLGLLGGDRRVEIRGIKTDDYPTAAKRPKCSILYKDKIKREFNLKIRNWDKALENFLNILSSLPSQE